ncbi:response regulator transcription factor [Amphibacillus indicireducens]|uniref:Response regulator transcription factor n=1 Tax=Amphibacillus indicireducens TaxID=1076330 RepID=A0ABP7V0J7_9BACI
MVTRRVLVVEDEEKIRSLVELYLINNEFDAITAENGEQGLRKTILEKPDLIILDILMPDLSGFEVCKMIRKTEGLEKIPVIFLSSLQESEMIIEGLDTGGDDYITKPFDPNVLIARINAIFRRIEKKQTVDYEKMQLIFEQLTYQERKILQWIEKGYTNKEIAEKLQLTEGTVKVYNHTIFQKLQVKNRTQAIVRAKEVNFL